MSNSQLATSDDSAARGDFLLWLRGVTLATPRGGDQALLEEVAWEVRPGDFWVVAGMPGTGKSELLEAVAGLTPMASGECRLFGREIGRMSDSELAATRRRVGFVYSEGGRLINHLNVLQNIALPLCYHRDCTLEESYSQLGALLEMTGLAHCLAWQPWRLKRAWSQRVALARALAMGPDLLLMDEPTASLDARQARWWMSVLEQLCQGHSVLQGRRLTMVVAVEDLRPWLGVARQFAILKGRRFLPLGGASEVAASEDPWVREYLAEPQANL